MTTLTLDQEILPGLIVDQTRRLIRVDVATPRNIPIICIDAHGRTREYTLRVTVKHGLVLV